MAKAAHDKEWSNMRYKRKVWRDCTVREWSEVALEARKAHRTVHMTRLFSIRVVKNSERPASDPRGKYKYSAVVCGHKVTDESWGAAQFQGIGSSPSSMAAGKLLDFYACLPGHGGQQADAEQAYIQADFTGTATWIMLPEEAWRKEWHGQCRCPVVRLEQSLYGHPDSGTRWAKHCDECLRKIGFEPVRGWDSVYYGKTSPTLRLSVYVDGFKLAGPKDQLSACWARIRRVIDLEDPEPFGQFLGCQHQRFNTNASIAHLPGATKETTHEHHGRHRPGVRNARLLSTGPPTIREPRADGNGTEAHI